MSAVVLVTGGANGIGRAVAEAVLAAGARAILWDVNEEALARTTAELGDRTRARALDVSDPAAVDAAAAAIEADWIPTHLVNNAGIVGRRMALDGVDADEIDRVLTVNVRSAFLVTNVFLRRRAPHPAAAIVNMTSIAAENGGAPGSAAYAASKGAIRSLTFAMARDLAPEIRVNAIAPGIIDTDIQKDVFADRAALMERTAAIPLERLGQACEVAEAARWLLLEAAYVTGEVVAISGGRK